MNPIEEISPALWNRKLWSLVIFFNIGRQEVAASEIDKCVKLDAFDNVGNCSAFAVEIEWRNGNVDKERNVSTEANEVGHAGT